jgi:hypothetical protein
VAHSDLPVKLWVAILEMCDKRAFVSAIRYDIRHSRQSAFTKTGTVLLDVLFLGHKYLLGPREMGPSSEGPTCTGRRSAALRSPRLAPEFWAVNRHVTQKPYRTGVLPDLIKRAHHPSCALSLRPFCHRNYCRLATISTRRPVRVCATSLANSFSRLLFGSWCPRVSPTTQIWDKKYRFPY